jgi:hypothetical protein
MTDAQKGFVRSARARDGVASRKELPEYRAPSRAHRKIGGHDPVRGVARPTARPATSTTAPSSTCSRLRRFLLQLDEEQLAQAEKKFADDNRKFVKESVKGSPDERRARTSKKYITQFEDSPGSSPPSSARSS